ADRHRNGRTGIDGFHSTHHRVRGGHGHGAHLVAANVLLHLGNHVHVEPLGAASLDAERRVELGQLPCLELDVQHRSDYLDDLSNVLCCDGCSHCCSLYVRM